jgi:hypothetical protein
MADLRDLISACEQSEINIQNLDENVVEWNANQKNGLITFLTDPQIVYEKMRNQSTKIGFVVWLPNDVFERLEKKNSEETKRAFEQFQADYE